MDDLAVGIDLGTTNSCVSLYINKKLKILENSEGGRITPSFIFFTNLGGTLVGEHAKRMAIAKPELGVYEIKRLIGRKFDDPSVANNLQYFPFKVDGNRNNDPRVVIQQQNQIVVKTPQELCIIILEKIKRDIEAKLGQPVNKAVITVPAYFNICQREATLGAAKAAGFTVLKLLNEPTAAALSYCYENDYNEKSYCLVYDLGGGTFDVAIIQKYSDNIEILSVDGDTHLGGHDFDNILVDYVCDELVNRYNYNPKLDKNNMRRLHNKCEDAKKALSVVEETIIVLNGFVKQQPSIEIIVTRNQFQILAKKLFKKTIDILDNCVRSSGLDKGVINEVILSGGSTRIPKIQQMICEYFNGKTLNKFVNPDECVAEGAALQAAMLSKSRKQDISEIRMKDVVSLSLGIETTANNMSFLVPKNTAIPTNKSSTFLSSVNQATTLNFSVFEGERSDVRKNRLLGTLTLHNLTPAPPGQCKVKVTMAVDLDGILTVTAQERYGNNVKQLQVDYTRGDRSDSHVKNTLRDLEDNRKEDNDYKAFAEKKTNLLQYCRRAVYNFESKNLILRYKGIYEKCQETTAAAEDITELEGKYEIEQMTDEIKQQCDPIVQMHNFEFMPQRLKPSLPHRNIQVTKQNKLY